MRTLSSTLEAAQQEMVIDPLVKIVLTHGVNSYTYEQDRILDINHSEEPFSQKAEVVLDNSDGALTDLALQGFKGVISYGAVASGNEYSATAPLWVIAPSFNSAPGVLDCKLFLIGIPNLMAEDKASGIYMPDEDDVLSVKTLINGVLGATLACFNHCQAYEVVWEVGYDGLADTYIPKDGFRIYVGGSRLAAFRKLLDYTGNVAIVKADGKWHIFKPTITGVVYDYQYSMESGHTFFSKAYRKRLVIPNYIVVQSQPDDDPQYSGTAQDNESYALLPKRDFKMMRLESNEQAATLATAILSKHQLWSEMGAADVPMNVGAEVFDYVKVTDSREDDYRIGNLGHLTRHVNFRKNEWRLNFSFGGWMTVKKALAGLDITADELEAYFSRLTVKDLYVENILAENVDFVWIDPENNIDLSLIGDTLDSLPDGEVYARVKTLHLDAGGIKLDENILYKAGYDPTGKLPYGTTLDGIADGTTYQRVKSAALTAGGLVILDQVFIDTGDEKYGLLKQSDISAGHIKLTSTTVIDGEWYDESGVEINASSGINIYGTNNALTTRATKTGTIQCYVGADGKIYAGGGNVILGASGLILKGQGAIFCDESLNIRGYVYGSAGGNLIISSFADLNLIPIGGEVYLTGNLSLSGTGKVLIPSAGRLRIPVGTNRYG